MKRAKETRMAKVQYDKVYTVKEKLLFLICQSLFSPGFTEDR